MFKAQWFDGKTAKPHEVSVSVSGRQIRVQSNQLDLSYDIAKIDWPERTRTGTRTLRLPDGSSLHAPSGKDFNALARAAGHTEKTVVRWQQSMPLVLLSFVLIIAIGIGGYIWGVPLATKVALNFVPQWVDRKIGESFIESFGAKMIRPTMLSKVKQHEISSQFAALVKKGYPDGDAPEYELRFHKSQVGPNAFALPGGIIIMTDELVELTDDKDNIDMVLGVLGHELGHVEYRHGMRMVGQVVIIGMFTSLAFGDYSDLIATIPILLGQSAYSREFEYESDTKAIDLMLKAGLEPAAMADFFRLVDPTVARDHKSGESTPADTERTDWGILFSSHPASAKRIARFEAASKNP